MSWLNQLYKTYELCKDIPEFTDLQGKTPLIPIYHTTQRAQIEVVVNHKGDFLRASVINKYDQPTIVPCTEDSDARSSGPVAHPLCDYLKYIAGDLSKYSDSKIAQKSHPEFEKYLEFLGHWVSTISHPKLSAIYSYIKKERLIQDLVEYKILPVAEDGKLIAKWSGDNNSKPPIFSALPSGGAPETAFIRWKVDIPGSPNSSTWLDRSLMNAWVEFYEKDTTKELLGMNLGFCSVTGIEKEWMVKKYPAKILYSGDGAKLISANDDSGYTFRGRFTDKGGKQAFDVSSEVVQKAHAALRWLIQRQSYKNDKQVYLAWTITGMKIPDPFANTNQLFGMNSENSVKVLGNGDIGQAFAKRLSKKIAGFHTHLGSTKQIIIIGLDSATTGRMAITYYRELSDSDFLQRVESWHKEVSWHQQYSKDIRFIGAPSPIDIAEAAYGQRDGQGKLLVNEKLLRVTVERLLPCIIDKQPIPYDLVNTIFNRVCSGQRKTNSGKSEYWDWEKSLGIICALFKGTEIKKNKEYKMSLELENTSRSYLYGRLLAVADFIERKALWLANENRSTNASRLMQRFSKHPYKTWMTIAVSLENSYKPRLRTSRSYQLKELEKELDQIMCLFVDSNDFKRADSLTPEFLLGFHCQRRDLEARLNSTKHEENTEKLGA